MGATASSTSTELPTVTSSHTGAAILTAERNDSQQDSSSSSTNDEIVVISTEKAPAADRDDHVSINCSPIMMPTNETSALFSHKDSSSSSSTSSSGSSIPAAPPMTPPSKTQSQPWKFVPSDHKQSQAQMQTQIKMERRGQQIVITMTTGHGSGKPLSSSFLSSSASLASLLSGSDNKHMTNKPKFATTVTTTMVPHSVVFKVPVPLFSSIKNWEDVCQNLVLGKQSWLPFRGSRPHHLTTDTIRLRVSGGPSAAAVLASLPNCSSNVCCLSKEDKLLDATSNQLNWRPWFSFARIHYSYGLIKVELPFIEFMDLVKPVFPPITHGTHPTTQSSYGRTAPSRGTFRKRFVDLAFPGWPCELEEDKQDDPHLCRFRTPQEYKEAADVSTLQLGMDVTEERHSSSKSSSEEGAQVKPLPGSSSFITSRGSRDDWLGEVKNKEPNGCPELQKILDKIRDKTRFVTLMRALNSPSSIRAQRLNPIATSHPSSPKTWTEDDNLKSTSSVPPRMWA